MSRRNFLSAAGIGTVASIGLPRTARALTTTASDDISLLHDILTMLHPGLYRYNSPMTIKTAIDRLAKQWTAEPTLAARYLNLSRFLTTIKCGHSYANFFNQKKAIKDQLFEGNTRLPFAFKWIGDQMVVLQDQSGSGSMPRGTIIKAINDVPVRDILSRLLAYARADGNNDGKRRALLSVSGADSIETFDVFYSLVYGKPGSTQGEPQSGNHRLRVRLPNSSSDVWVDLPALTLAQRQSFMKKRDYRGDTPVWDWTMRDDGIAVLTMDGWGLYNSKWKWEDWLNDRMDSLNGAKGLIVDIRENEGGQDCGDVILARLAGRDIIKPTADRLVRYRSVPKALNPYLDTWDDSFRDWGADVSPYNDRYYRLSKWEGGSTLVARGPRIDVPLTVLTSPQNSSATFQFASLCRSLDLGTLVGETTGGNQRGINGGAFFFARLPESGIEFDVPLVGYFPKGRLPDAGIAPDIKVASNAEAIAAGDDPQMDTAIAHLLRQ